MIKKISYINELFYRKTKISLFKRKFILLIPPTCLNGGFGDDIMVSSFYHFYSDFRIILFTQHVIERKDMFSEILYKKWGTRILWNEINKIYLLGADNLSGTYGNEEVLKKIEILKTANNYKIKNDILGFSLSEKTTEVVKKSFLEISKFTFFKLRDPDSYKRALSFLPQNRVEQVADIAFLCPLILCTDKEYIDWINFQNNENRKIIAICPNSIHMRNYEDQQYISQYVEAIELINNSGNYSFVLLYHDLRDLNKGWNDMTISKSIYSRLKTLKNVYFTDRITNGVQLKSYLPYVDITLTSRMHLGISGYSVGKPMFGITYENKFSGLQKLFGISPERSLVEYTELENLKEKFDLFIQDYENNVDLVKDNIQNVIELSKKNFGDK